MKKHDSKHDNKRCQWIYVSCIYTILLGRTVGIYQLHGRNIDMPRTQHLLHGVLCNVVWT